MAIFSKPHYEFLAVQLRKNAPSSTHWSDRDARNYFETLLLDFSEALEKDNPAFDRERFIKTINSN